MYLKKKKGTTVIFSIHKIKKNGTNNVEMNDYNKYDILNLPFPFQRLGLIKHISVAHNGRKKNITPLLFLSNKKVKNKKIILINPLIFIYLFGLSIQ